LKPPLPVEPALGPGAAKASGLSPEAVARLRRLAIGFVVLVLCFAKPLVELIRLALGSEFYSYILLVPFISGYLIWTDKRGLALDSQPVRARALVPLLIAAGILGGYWAGRFTGWRPGLESYLATMMVSFLGFLASAGFFCLGPETLRRVAFPAVLLVFIVPLPGPVFDYVADFMQHGSADVAAGLFGISGMPFLRQDLCFQLPGIALRVAPECSGIRSTMVLLITSLVAGHWFLNSRWRRAVLVVAVIPLALLRNGFRVFTIGQLCVHIGPQMIESPIHRQGGPLFFALSLIPFLLLLLWLRRQERKRAV
jgi:exosortase C (VPDSG-CTERM-specific)